MEGIKNLLCALTAFINSILQGDTVYWNQWNLSFWGPPRSHSRKRMGKSSYCCRTDTVLPGGQVYIITSNTLLGVRACLPTTKLWCSTRLWSSSSHNPPTICRICLQVIYCRSLILKVHIEAGRNAWVSEIVCPRNIYLHPHSMWMVTVSSVFSKARFLCSCSLLRTVLWRSMY